MNNRQKMRIANQASREYLKSIGYNYVCLIPHGYSYEQIVDGNIQKQIDIFGLFDGVAIKKIPGYKPLIVFLQIKTNKLPSLKKYKEFSYLYHVNIFVLVYDGKLKKIKECRAIYYPKVTKTK